MLNSRLGLLAAAPCGSGSKSLHRPGHPFSRSYGVRLPSSLTRFLSRTLGYSPCPPVSVCGTDPPPSPLSGFSRRCRVGRFRRPWAPSPSRLGLVDGGFSCRPPCPLGPPLPVGGRPSVPRPRVAPAEKYGNINPWSIDYAFRPRLRIRLTLGGRTWPRKPWTFGGRDSHPPSRYSCLHDRSHGVHRPFRDGFAPHATLSYHAPGGASAASAPALVPIICGAEPLDQ